MFKSPLLMLAIAAVCALFAALVGPYFIDWNAYRPQIEAQLSQLSGQKVEIGDNITVRLLPAPRLKLENIRIDAAEDASAAGALRGTATPHAFTAARLNASLALTPLMRGRLKLTALELEQPVLQAWIGNDGRLRLGLFAPARGARLPRADTVELDNVEFTDGTIHLHDRRHGVTHTVEAVNLHVSASAVTGPMRINGQFVFNGIARELKLSTGKFRADDDGQVRGRMRADITAAPQANATGDESRLLIDGMVRDLFGAPEFTGRLRYAVTPGEDAPARGAAFAFQAHVAATLDQMKLERISVKLGQGVRAAALTGEARIAWSKTARVDAALKAVRLKLGQPGTTQAGADFGALALDAVRALRGFGATGKISLDAGAVITPGGELENAGLTLSLSKSTIHVQRAIATLPGHARVTLTGSYRPQVAQTPPLTARAAASQQAGKISDMGAFSGTVAISALNARDLIAYGLPAAMATRLRNLPRVLGTLTVKSPVIWRGGVVELKDGAIALDDLRGRLDASFSPGPRPSVRAQIEIDDADFDRLALVYDKAPAKSAKDRKPAAANTLSLTSFDAQLAVRVARARYRGVDMAGLEGDFALRQGTLAIRRLRARDIAGLAFATSGEIGALTDNPRGTLSGRVEGARLSGLARLTGLPERFARSLDKLAPVKLDLDLALSSAGDDAREAVVKLAGKLGGSDLSLNARLNGIGKALSTGKTLEDGTLALRARLNNVSSAVLLTQIAAASGITMDTRAPPKAGPMPGGLDLALTGKIAKPLDLALGLNLHGAQAQLAGKAALKGGRLALEADVSAQTKSAAPLLAGLGLAFENAMPDRKTPRTDMPLNVKGVIAGSDHEFVLTGFKARLKETVLGVNGTADFTGARPHLRANASVTGFSLPWLFAALAGEPPRAAGSPASKPRDKAAAQVPPVWSSAPLRFGLLPHIDADITFTTGRFELGGDVALREVKSRLTLKDGAVDIASFSGKLIGGVLSVTGKAMLGDEGLALNLHYDLAGADLARLVIDKAGDPAARGTLALAGKLKGQGLSALGIVSALSGTGTVKLRDGALVGINPDTFTRAMETASNVTELDGFIKGILVDGEMKFAALDSEFALSSGLVRAGDMKIAAEGAVAKVISFIDLPAWRTDSEWRLSLTAYPNSPPVRMIYSGPLSAPVRAVDVRGLRKHLIMARLKRQMNALEKIQTEQEAEARKLNALRERNERLRKERLRARPPAVPAPEPVLEPAQPVERRGETPAPAIVQKPAPSSPATTPLQRKNIAPAHASPAQGPSNVTTGSTPSAGVPVPALPQTKNPAPEAAPRREVQAPPRPVSPPVDLAPKPEPPPVTQPVPDLPPVRVTPPRRAAPSFQFDGENQ